MTSDLVLSPDLIVKGEVETEFDSLAVGIDLSASKNETSITQPLFLEGVKISFTLSTRTRCVL